MHDEEDEPASDSESGSKSMMSSKDSEPNSDWNWTEQDEQRRSDNDLMGDEELLEELEGSIVDCQQELVSLRKYHVQYINVKA